MTKTANFLNEISGSLQTTIVRNIAEHYGISESDAREEITAEYAEHLLDYITGNLRSSIQALMVSKGYF